MHTKVLPPTGAALIENNEASTKLTTANGGTFTWAQLDSVANHVTARLIGSWHALTWLATVTGWTRRKRSDICSGKLVMSTWFDMTWTWGTASRLYMCKSVLPPHPLCYAEYLIRWYMTELIDYVRELLYEDNDIAFLEANASLFAT